MENADKTSIRRQMKALRRTLSVETMCAASERIRALLFALPCVKKARHILFYYPFDNEVDTRLMMCQAWSVGQIVSLPAIEEKNLAPYVVCDMKSSLQPQSPYGIMGPDTTICPKENTAQIDVVVVPGLAFDHRKHRIGFGAGYYDRFLAVSDVQVACVGICYHFQLYDCVPCESHDIIMDYIITERACF